MRIRSTLAVSFAAAALVLAGCSSSADTWDVSTSDEICGTASAGLPSELLDYCE